MRGLPLSPRFGVGKKGTWSCLWNSLVGESGLRMHAWIEQAAAAALSLKVQSG